MDPRHLERIKIVQNLFASTFHDIDSLDNHLPHPKDEVSLAILSKLTEIDQHIATHAPKYPLDKIAKTDLSILRLAVYELFIEPKEPQKVVINEAVELAKDLGNERSFAFVNAVLGSLVTQMHQKNDSTT